MMDLAERGCPALGSSSVRRLVPAEQTISHAPLTAFTPVPGPHISGGGGDGGGGTGGGGVGHPNTGTTTSTTELSELASGSWSEPMPIIEPTPIIEPIIAELVATSTTELSELAPGSWSEPMPIIEPIIAELVAGIAFIARRWAVAATAGDAASATK